jgi:hypothetical protein
MTFSHHSRGEQLQRFGMNSGDSAYKVTSLIARE